ncbi:replication endonuclease [Massilia sp. LC238]|uniref:replication endonuclease n=1 Tax=Massilia sp. LC238 TaxID=1502852 RepID=UPI0013773E7F|nr:replication endonuclease [Massilia sp. LC238]
MKPQLNKLTADACTEQRSNAKFEKVQSRSTRIGVAEMLHLYESEQTRKLLTERYGSAYETENEILKSIRRQDEDELNAIRREVARRVAMITSAEGKIANYIDLSRHEIKQLAVSLAELYVGNRDEKISEAQNLLGHNIPGSTRESQYARVCDASFWRRSLTVAVERGREQFFLRLGKLGLSDERYASDLGVDAREQQLRMQQRWIENTVLRKKNDAEMGRNSAKSEIRLADVVKTPKQKFAKLYSFIKAMEKLAQKSKLHSAMLTITLEPEWHPNPQYGKNTWNGKSPRAAHKSFCTRWQAVLRDLHRIGIRLSGFRATEPHGDGCPHYHTWLIYRPEHEKKILLTIMRYFQLKLKVRSPVDDKEATNDIIYENRNDFIVGKWRACTKEDEESQVELSRIDPARSKAASYVMKYVMGTLPKSLKDLAQVDNKKNAGQSKKSDGMARVDTYRAIWGMNQGRLFGVAKCLSVWDQFRRMQKPPAHWFLRKLWVMARGGTAEGRVAAGCGQRADAYHFLQMLGGLDAARNGKRNTKRYVISRLVETGVNKYGDKIEKTIGLRLLKKKNRKVEKLNISAKTNKKVSTSFVEVLVTLRTKLDEWAFETKIQSLFKKFPSSTRAAAQDT